MLRSMGKATLRASAVATLVAMGIAGLWHGPAWTYVIFGLMHGCALVINQVWKKRRLKLPDWLGWMLTFGFVNLAFVFFRSPTVPAALHMIWSMAPRVNLFGTTALQGVLPLTLVTLARPIAIGAVLAFAFKSAPELARAFRPSLATAGAAAGLILLALFFINSSPAKQFVYFAF
jgi:hypothetical protein